MASNYFLPKHMAKCHGNHVLASSQGIAQKESARIDWTPAFDGNGSIPYPKEDGTKAPSQFSQKWPRRVKGLMTWNKDTIPAPDTYTLLFNASDRQEIMTALIAFKGNRSPFLSRGSVECNCCRI